MLIDDAPAELRVGIQEFWPESEWENAAALSKLESAWDAFAIRDTTDRGPCGTIIEVRDGIKIAAEHSIGYFQIDACAHPDWEWQRLYNARENCGTAHALWNQRGWEPWFFSARALGLI